MIRLVGQSLVLMLAAVLCSQALAQESFRTAGGDIIETGMTKAQIRSIIGPPYDGPADSAGQQYGELPTSSYDRWVYRLSGSIGGSYVVEINFADETATQITTRQVE